MNMNKAAMEIRFQNVLEIRFVIIKCGLTEDPYGLLISFFFLARNLCQIIESFPSCLGKN